LLDLIDTLQRERVSNLQQNQKLLNI